jgi:hypothetical protein
MLVLNKNYKNKENALFMLVVASETWEYRGSEVSIGLFDLLYQTVLYFRSFSLDCGHRSGILGEHLRLTLTYHFRIIME